jgi:WD40 repeat protein
LSFFLFIFLASYVLNVTLSGHTNAVFGVAFSSDHSYLASCSSDGYLNVWNYSTSWLLTNHLYNEACNALIKLPNGQLASKSTFNIKIWSPISLMKTLTGHTNNVYALAVSPDRSLIASGSSDNTTKIWKYKSQTAALKTFSGCHIFLYVCGG